MIPSGFDLQSCLQSLATIEVQLNTLTRSMTEAEFQAPTRRGGWSVGYCLEHLVLTGQAFVATWDAALKSARPNGLPPSGPYPYSWLYRRILGFVEPPYRIKTRTANTFVPCARRPMEEVLSRFLQMHREMARRLEMSRSLDARRVKVQSPFRSRISYPLGFSFDLVLAHERRHLWQASQINLRDP